MAETFALTLRATGLPFLIRELYARHRVSILLYHRPPPEILAAHLAYLTPRYNVIPIETLVAAIRSRDWSSIPPKALVLHFDDGHANNAKLVEVFRRYRVRPTIYLCSHVVGTNRHFWSLHGGRRALAIRYMDHRALCKQLRAEQDFAPEREYPDRQALSRAEIDAMQPDVDFQAHGRFHFSLLSLDDDELERELRESKTMVERLSGRPCEHFSFPYGDYGARDLAAVRRCGFRSARTTEPGWNTVDTDPYRLRIVADVPNDASVNQLCAELTGVRRFLKRSAYRIIVHHLQVRRARNLMRRQALGGADRQSER